MGFLFSQQCVFMIKNKWFIITISVNLSATVIDSAPFISFILRSWFVCHGKSKYSEISDVTMNFYLYEEKLKRYIKNMKSSCAHCIDGFLSEHLKCAIDTDLIINQLCIMFSLCLQYGVPDILYTWNSYSLKGNHLSELVFHWLNITNITDR